MRDDERGSSLGDGKKVAKDTRYAGKMKNTGEGRGANCSMYGIDVIQEVRPRNRVTIS